jgi:hypothetical protein
MSKTKRKSLKKPEEKCFACGVTKDEKNSRLFLENCPSKKRGK